MAKTPHLTQDKLDLLAQIPEEVIELISSGVKTQANLAAMFHGLKSRVIENALAGEMEHHLNNNPVSLLSDDLSTSFNRRNGYK